MYLIKYAHGMFVLINAVLYYQFLAISCDLFTHIRHGASILCIIA